MRRSELWAFAGLSLALVVAGLFMLFGPWALVGCGAVTFAGSFFIDVDG